MWCYQLVGEWGVGDDQFIQVSYGWVMVAPISAFTAEDTTVLIIWQRVWMDTLLVGRVGGLLPFLTSWSARKK